MRHPDSGKTRRWRSRSLIALVAIFALVAAACGDDDDDDEASSAPAVTTTAAAAAAEMDDDDHGDDDDHAHDDEPDSDMGLPTGNVELRMAYFNGGGQTQIDFREEQAADFNEMHPNVTVRMEPIPDWSTTIFPQIAAGTAADVLWGGTDDGYTQMVAINAFQSLQPFIDDEGFDLSPWPDNMIQHFSDADGGSLILPVSNLAFNFLYYNKNLFDAAGVDYPDASWTVDDLINATRDLSIPDEQWGLSFAWGDLYQTWMRMYGCEFANDATYPSDYTYNGPACVEALTDLDELARNGYINWELGAKFGGLAPGDTAGETAFSGGHTAMLLSGTWEAGSISENSGGAFEFDAAPAPLKQGGKIQGAAEGFGIYSGTDHPEWAWELVKFVAGTEGQEREAKLGLGTSPIESILDGAYCTSPAPPANKCEVAKIGAANTEWEPLTAAWGPGFWDVITPAAEAAFLSDAAPNWQEVLDEAVDLSRMAGPLS